MKELFSDCLSLAYPSIGVHKWRAGYKVSSYEGSDKECMKKDNTISIQNQMRC